MTYPPCHVLEQRLFTGMGRRPAESSTAKGLERKMATRWQQDYMYHLGEGGSW